MKTILAIFILTTYSMTTQGQRANLFKMSSFVRHTYTLTSMSHYNNTNKNSGKTTDYHICAFVKATGNATDAFETNRCKILAQIGDIFIADIPIPNLGQLSLEKCIKRIETGYSKKLLMDSVGIQIGAGNIYDAIGLPQAYTGKGVVIGIQDIGFDLTHPNFFNSDGTEYRINRFWDMLSTDTIDSKMYVGAEYTCSEDILSYAHSRDGKKETHGTLTLGAAAGSGAGTPYKGIAFDSEICLVSNAVSSDEEFIRPEDLHKYTYATDVLGFKYIFDYAKQQGKPCVISFSEGSNQDLKGDDILYYEAIKQICGPGRIIVSAAGNTGHINNYIHKEKGRNSAGTFIRLWGNKPLYFTTLSDEHFNMRFVSYDNKNDTVIIDTKSIVSSPDSSKTFEVMLSNRKHLISAVAFTSCYDNQKTVYDINISGPEHIGITRPLSVEIIGKECEIELFRGNGELGGDPHNTKLCDGNNSHGIYSPSSSPDIICVGASSYRTQYTNHEGDTIIYNCGSSGERANYSSVGPTLDGRKKPDILAPGTNIIVSASSYYIENNPELQESVTSYLYKNGRKYGWMSASGTSLSSPIVGGIIALWLQANPLLTPDDIFSILSRTCKRYGDMESDKDNRYGYGQIDAYRGLLDVIGLSSIDYISKHQPKHINFSLKGKALHIIFNESNSRAMSVRIYNTKGQLLRQNIIPAGCTHHTCSLHDLVNGIYVIQLEGKTKDTSGSTIIRL